MCARCGRCWGARRGRCQARNEAGLDGDPVPFFCLWIAGLDLGGRDFDGVVGGIKLAGDLHFFADVLPGLLCDVEEVTFRLALGAMVHDERVLPVLESWTMAPVKLCGIFCACAGAAWCWAAPCSRRQAPGYGKCEGCEPGEQSVILGRQNILPFSF